MGHLERAYSALCDAMWPGYGALHESSMKPGTVLDEIAAELKRLRRMTDTQKWDDVDWSLPNKEIARIHGMPYVSVLKTRKQLGILKPLTRCERLMLENWESPENNKVLGTRLGIHHGVVGGFRRRFKEDPGYLAWLQSKPHPRDNKKGDK